MKSLKCAARKGAIISVTALAALTLASCSAGQITQTSTKVAAVDGTEGESTDGNIAVRDVTIYVEPATGEAAVKFFITNQGYTDADYLLRSVSVDGQEAVLSPAPTAITRDQAIIADSAANLEMAPRAKSDNIQYIETTLENDSYGYGGYREVVFDFGAEQVTVNAPIAAPQLPAGEYNREVDSEYGYTTEVPHAGPKH